MALLTESECVTRSLPIPHEFKVVCPRLYYSPCGDLFISSTTHVIFVCMQSKPNEMEIYAGSIGKNGCTNGDRVLETTFDTPRGMASDDAGLLVADTNSNKIRLVCGNQVITYAGTGETGHHDGRKEQCTFNKPVCIVKSGSTIFISEPYKIRMIDNRGMVTSIHTFRNTRDSATLSRDITTLRNRSVLMVSPDSRKLYEIDYDYDSEKFMIVIVGLDSMTQTGKVSLDYTCGRTEWPAITSTPEGYIISHQSWSELNSWDSDDEISPIHIFRDQYAYQMAISPESGTLAYVTVPRDIISSPDKICNFSPEYISFAHSFTKSWHLSMPNSAVDFSNLFDCDAAGSDIQLVLNGVPTHDGESRDEVPTSGLNQTTSSTVLKLHSTIISPYFPRNNLLQSLEILNKAQFCAVDCKIDFLKSLYQPEIFKISFSNILRDYFDHQRFLSRLCSVIVLYNMFHIDYRWLQCTLWRSFNRFSRNENDIRNQDLLIKLFCYAWKHAKHRAVLDIVTSFMTRYPDIIVERWSAFYSLMSSDSTEMVQYLQLFFQGTRMNKLYGKTAKTSLHPHKSILTLCDKNDDGSVINPSSTLFQHLQNLFKNECLVAKSLPESQDSILFRIGIIGCERYLHAHESILYSRWQFFRRMMDAGCGEEISSKHILLPVDFPYDLLECVVRILYYQHPQPLNLSYDSCFFFMDQGAQFNLTDFERNAIEPFQSLHLYCSLQVYEPINVQNSLKMASIYSQFGKLEELEDAIAVARVNIDAAISASPHELRNLNPEIVDKLTRDLL